MIGEWSEPDLWSSRTRPLVEATFGALERYCVWNVTTFRAPAIYSIQISPKFAPATKAWQHHQILHLPRKVTLQHQMMRFSQTSPNRNDIPKYEENVLTTDEASST